MNCSYRMEVNWTDNTKLQQTFKFHAFTSRTCVMVFVWTQQVEWNEMNQYKYSPPPPLFSMVRFTFHSIIEHLHHNSVTAGGDRSRGRIFNYLSSIDPCYLYLGIRTLFREGFQSLKIECGNWKLFSNFNFQWTGWNVMFVEVVWFEGVINLLFSFWTLEVILMGSYVFYNGYEVWFRRLRFCYYY